MHKGSDSLIENLYLDLLVSKNLILLLQYTLHQT